MNPSDHPSRIKSSSEASARQLPSSVVVAVSLRRCSTFLGAIFRATQRGKLDIFFPSSALLAPERRAATFMRRGYLSRSRPPGVQGLQDSGEREEFEARLYNVAPGRSV